MRRPCRTFLILIVLLFVLDGCRIGPRYCPPEPIAPEEWKAPYSEIEQPFGEFWWEIFECPQLNSLEQLALQNNPNLYAALERVFQARAQTGSTCADLFPQVTFNPNFTNTGTLFKIYGIPANVLPQLKRVFRIHQLQYFTPLNFSYELDLWRKLTGQCESACMNAQAEEDAFETTMLTLTAEVASYYFNLRTLDKQIVLLKDTMESREKTMQLTRSRFKSGIVPLTDVSNAEILYYNVESDYQDTVRQRNNLENALATLLGVPASDFTFEPDPLEGSPPIVPPGLPSTILCQRPDINQAERKMASLHALIGVAYASFFPTVTITGALGFFSPDARHFLKWASRYWSFGADLLQTVFDAGKRYSEMQEACARYREAFFNYKQTVLTAFQEVEDALNDLEMEAKQADSLFQSSEAAKKAAFLSDSRYKKGVANFLEVLDTQRSQLDAQRNYIAVQGGRFQATVNLIKALGGGWNSPSCLDADCCP